MNSIIESDVGPGSCYSSLSTYISRSEEIDVTLCTLMGFGAVLGLMEVMRARLISLGGEFVL